MVQDGGEMVVAIATSRLRSKRAKLMSYHGGRQPLSVAIPWRRRNNPPRLSGNPRGFIRGDCRGRESLRGHGLAELDAPVGWAAQSSLIRYGVP